jgi:murein tripeptide amidase MpaA
MFSILIQAVAAIVRYDGHQVWSVKLNSTDQFPLFQVLADNRFIDLWALNKGEARFSLGPEKRSKVKDVLTKVGLNRSILMHDIQQELDEQDRYGGDQHPLINAVPPFFTKYQTIEKIHEYFDSLATQYPMLVEPFSIGKSYKGQEITGISIHCRNCSESQHEFLFHGGIHAREWIGPATVSYMATQLVELYGTDPLVTRLLDTYTFHIIPVLNVDGYKYSHTEDRMWRKNLQPNGMFCKGTDLNRNWDAGWSGPGASRNPCSDSYHGSAPFSAPESAAISSWIKHHDKLISYIDFHAFSQLWMYPFGYTCKDPAPDADDLATVGKRAVKALKKVGGESFAVGDICNIIYQASGSSVDWAYKYSNVKYSFAVELRDKGKYGFLLPEKYIVPSGQETLAAYLEMVQAIEEVEGWK